MPGLLVLLFTRVTYNRYIGLALTVGLIAASVYKGYTNTFPLISNRCIFFNSRFLACGET